METIIQILAATVGTIGFCLMFNTNPKHIVIPAIGGGLCWAIYLYMRHLGLSIFLATFIASALIGIYGEIFAHLCKMPTTVCFMPSCVPLIPGSNLYYALGGLLARDWTVLRENTTLLVWYAIGIAAGLALIYELDSVRLRIEARIALRRGDGAKV